MCNTYKIKLYISEDNHNWKYVAHSMENNMDEVEENILDILFYNSTLKRT